MDEDFPKQDVSVCLPASEEDVLGQHKSEVNSGLESTEAKVNGGINGHEDVGHDLRDGKELDVQGGMDGNSIQDQDVQDDEAYTKADANECNEIADQEDGCGDELDLHNDGIDAQEEIPCGEELDTHDVGNDNQEDDISFGDKMDMHDDEIDAQKDSVPCGDELYFHNTQEGEISLDGDLDTHNDGIAAEDDLDTQDDGMGAQEGDIPLDDELGTHPDSEMDAQEDENPFRDREHAEEDSFPCVDEFDRIDGGVDCKEDKIPPSDKLDTHNDGMPAQEDGVPCESVFNDTADSDNKDQKDSESNDERLIAERDTDERDDPQKNNPQEKRMITEIVPNDGDLRDDNLENVHEGDNDSDGYNISGDDPPFSSLSRVETNDDIPDEDEQENKLSDNLLSDEDKLAEDLITTRSPAPLLDDEEGMDTSMAEHDTTLSSNKSEELLEDEALAEDLDRELQKTNRDSEDVNIPIDEKEDQNVQSSPSQAVNSDKNKSVRDICSEVIEEIVNEVVGDVGNKKEENVESMEVNGEESSTQGVKPENSTSHAKESDGKCKTTKDSEKETSDGVICLSSDDEDMDTESKKSTSQKASSESKNKDQHGNSNNGSSTSDVKATKENNPPSTKADDGDDDIMVIEETSSAPARKPTKAVDNSGAAKRCKLCKKIFGSAEQLRKHVREAHGLIMIDKEQILRCRICSFRGIWSVFVKHLAEKHPSSSHLIKDVDKDKRMPCGVCSFRGQKAELEKHMREKHPGVARSLKKINTSSTFTKVADVAPSKEDRTVKSPYTLRPRKVQPTTKESPPVKDTYTYTKPTSKPTSVPSSNLTTKKVWTLKQSSMLVDVDTSETNESVAAEGVMKQKAFFEKLVVDGYIMGKKQIRLDVLLEKCNKTIFECGLCQQSFPNYLQVYFHQKVCLPNSEKSSRIIVYLPFETIMSQFLYKTIGMKKMLQCIHCTNKVSAQNVSAMIQALHLSVHVVPEVIIRTYYNGVVNNRVNHARQDSNKKAYSWDEVLKPVSVNRSSVVSSRNNNLDRYICTSGRLHQMESRHVLNDDLHDFGRIHSSSSDDESELWETTYKRRKHAKKKKKMEFLSPNSKQKQSLLASVNYKLTSKKQHERDQRVAKREQKRRNDNQKRDGSDSDNEVRFSAKQQLSFSPPKSKVKKTSNNSSNVHPQTKLRSLLVDERPDSSFMHDDSGEQLNEFGGLVKDDNYFPEFEGFAEDDEEPDALSKDNQPEDNQPEDNQPEALPEEESPSNEEVKEEPSQEPEELGPLLTEEDLAEYWRLFEGDETNDAENKNAEEPVLETKPKDFMKPEEKSILSLLSSLPRENDVLDYYGGSKQPLSSKSLIFMTTQHVFKYFALMPAGGSSANFACNLRGCTAFFSATVDMAAHLCTHFPMRVIIQDYPATSGGSHVLPLLTSKQVLQHYRARKAASDERVRYSCCYKRCNASSILDQSLAVHLMKHFSFICIGNILLRRAKFADHPLLSHYKCLRGARNEHSSIFQLTCNECEFFVTTYIFKGKIGDVVEAELSAHALSHDVGNAAEEALRKMCRATSGKLQQHQVPKPQTQNNSALKVIPKPTQKPASVPQPGKYQPSADAKRTVSVTEPELLKKFGATVNGWKCLVKNCGFLHRGVKDLFIFANHLRRHILGCKKIIVMKKKASTTTTNRIPSGNVNSAPPNKPKPPIDVVTIDDASDEEQSAIKAVTNKMDPVKEFGVNDVSKDDQKTTDVKSCNVKVVLNKLPLDSAIRDKIEALKSADKNIDVSTGVEESSSLKRKIDDDNEKSGKKSCMEENTKENKERTSELEQSNDIPDGDDDVLNDDENTKDSGKVSEGTKRKREETDITTDSKNLRLSPLVDDDTRNDSKLESRLLEEGDATVGESQEGGKVTAENNQDDDGKDLVDPSMEKLIAELKSTNSDPIILPITTVEKFFEQEIQSNLNRSSAVVGTMNFTCRMCEKTGFKGKDFELVRHLESHIGKEISLKMKELQVKEPVKDTKDDSTSSPKGKTKSNSRSLVHRNLEDLRKCSDDKIQLHFEEVENFYVKNVRLSRTKSEVSYGVIMYSCIECSKGELKTEHLVKHLEDHVGKTVKMIRNPAKSNGPNPT